MLCNSESACTGCVCMHRGLKYVCNRLTWEIGSGRLRFPCSSSLRGRCFHELGRLPRLGRGHPATSFWFSCPFVVVQTMHHPPSSRAPLKHGEDSSEGRSKAVSINRAKNTVRPWTNPDVSHTNVHLRTVGIQTWCLFVCGQKEVKHQLAFRSDVCTHLPYEDQQCIVYSVSTFETNAFRIW
jgi:hypothetical protein